MDHQLLHPGTQEATPAQVQTMSSLPKSLNPISQSQQPTLENQLTDPDEAEAKDRSVISQIEIKQSQLNQNEIAAQVRESLQISSASN